MNLTFPLFFILYSLFFLNTVLFVSITLSRWSYDEVYFKRVINFDEGSSLNKNKHLSSKYRVAKFLAAWTIDRFNLNQVF